MSYFNKNLLTFFLLVVILVVANLDSFAQKSIILETKDKTVPSIKNSFPNVEISEDGKLIAITNNVNRFGENKVGGVLIFNASNFKLLRVLKGHETVIIHLKFSPDGSKILTSEYNKNIILWDVKSGEILQKIKLDKAALLFDLNSRNQAVFANFGRTISIYDLNSGQQMENFKLDKSSYVTNVYFSDDDHVRIVSKHKFYEYNILTKEFVTNVELEDLLYFNAYSNSNSDIIGKNGRYYFTSYDVLITANFSDKKIVSQEVYEFDDFFANGVLAHPELDEIYLISRSEFRVYDRSMNLLHQIEASKKAKWTKGNLLTKITPINNWKHLVITDLLSLSRIYSIEEKRFVAYLYADTDDHFAIISPKGNMEGDIEAINDLEWNDGVNEIGLENTFEALYSPNLMRQLLAGEEISQAIDLNEVINNKPSVKILSIDGQSFKEDEPLEINKKNISISIEATSPGILSEIRLYQNRKLVGVKNDFTETGGNTKRVNFKIALNNAYGPENYFVAKAVNPDGIESDAAKLIIKYMNDEKASPRLFLLTVGVNQYKNPKYSLNYARPDAEAFTEIIQKETASLFEEVFVTTLIDAEASRENLINAFNEIKTASNEQDLFIFYYAGHGVMSSGDIGKPTFYMVLPAVTKLYGSDQMLMDLAISAEEIKQFSMEINAQKQIYIVDACQSGGALESFASRGVAEEKAIANLARSTGTFWLSATGSEQFASEFETLGHGIFTYVILEGLKGAANSGEMNRNITIRELSAFIENRVPILSEEYKGTPQYPASYGYGNDFPILLLKEN